MATPNLTREDASVRSALLHIDSYDIALDLTDGSGKPGERTFSSTTTIRFSATSPGMSTFLDIAANSVRRVTMNGRPVAVGGYRPETGIALTDLAQQNTVVVEAEMAYTNTGEGLHRFVDPLDGEVYIYSQFETADAKQVYACFDQPDLKASFTFHVSVPDWWQVISNAQVERVEDRVAGKTVHFATTARLSTYVTAVVAGPYHEVRDHHDGIDLGLYCRSSLAQYLDPDEVLTVTKQGFDWFHANFGLRYAFDKYDQIIVPEFNAGAMENAGCVTIREDYIYRGKVTDARRERRGETILHEMAHMWFGDLVTMRWWDDLWLNESFATYAAVLCQTSATRWRTAWTTFANVMKAWAYRQDQLPSTHPIATDAPDVQTAELNFDGITYAKGASVLKQLGAYVGVEAFLAGLRVYFVEHAYGNTTLADLLAALETSSGRDLAAWSKLWLGTAGMNKIRPEFSLDATGRYADFVLVQTAPDNATASNVLRPHRLAVGLYRDEVVDGERRLVRSQRIELDVVGERTPVDELIGVEQPDLLLVNDDDLTYCGVSLDERSLRTLRSGGIARLVDSLPRALCWSNAWQMTRDGELATRDYLELVLRGAEAETDVGVLQSLTRQLLRALEIYADPAFAPEGYARLAEKARGALLAAEPGSDYQLAWVHAFLGAGSSNADIATMRGLLTGEVEVPGLAVEEELRWAILQALSGLGAATIDDIAAELDRDPSAAGQRHATIARTLQPTAEAKAGAWRQAFEDPEVPNSALESLVAGFAHPRQADLVAPYRRRYFEQAADVWALRSSELAQVVVIGLFPRWTSAISAETVADADAFLARDDIPAALRRLVSEGRADVLRALRARAVDRAAGAA
jgi:aminopeptidase N